MWINLDSVVRLHVEEEEEEIEEPEPWSRCIVSSRGGLNAFILIYTEIDGFGCRFNVRRLFLPVRLMSRPSVIVDKMHRQDLL